MMIVTKENIVAKCLLQVPYLRRCLKFSRILTIFLLVMAKKTVRVLRRWCPVRFSAVGAPQAERQPPLRAPTLVLYIEALPPHKHLKKKNKKKTVGPRHRLAAAKFNFFKFRKIVT